MDCVELLMRFGLTRIEASIYLTLHSQGAMTGYEAAKHSGISRSNAYTALAALTEKGAAFVIEGSPARYTAVSCEEFCGNHLHSLEDAAVRLAKLLPAQKQSGEGYVTICGEARITDKIRYMLREAEQRAYIAASHELISELTPSLRELCARGIRLVIITDEPPDLPGAVIYLTKRERWQLRLITDSVRVLTGEPSPGADCSCLYSEKANLVDLIKDSLKNEITLIKLQTKEEAEI